MFNRLYSVILSILLAVIVQSAVAATQAEVNLYSARKEQLIKPLLDLFTKQTGIKVNLITGDADALIKRLETEGENSPADLLLTTDAGRLHRAKSKDLTQAFGTAELHQMIPSAFRDADNHWYGLSLRARPIMYVKAKVKPQELSSYEALTDSKWQGRICIRSSNNIYNQSLVASMIAASGTDNTTKWTQGLVKNFARKPSGGDRDQIKAAVAGECDIAIANTYYLAGMLTSNDAEEREIAEKIGVFWPNQMDRGSHVNVSGVALLKSAQNIPQAIRLVEFLASTESQEWYAHVNNEYPVRSNVAFSPILEEWGTFKSDPIILSRLGELNADAVKIMDKAGWH